MGSKLTISLGLLLLIGGCTASQESRQGLRDAYRELESLTPDMNRIAAAADAYLADQPAGPDAADAFYLRGRALELKAQASNSREDLATAQQAYRLALNHQPRPMLEGRIRIGLGNVLYFQEYYAPAMSELAQGVTQLEKSADQAWANYRIGLCQQRLGQWEQADHTFATVISQYPGSEPAKRSLEHHGFKAFFVQVGAYATAKDANTVVTDLKKLGQPSVVFQDRSRTGPQYVRVGPLTSYAVAQTVRQQLSTRYKDAAVVP